MEEPIESVMILMLLICGQEVKSSYDLDIEISIPKARLKT